MCECMCECMCGCMCECVCGVQMDECVKCRCSRIVRGANSVLCRYDSLKDEEAKTESKVRL